MGNVDESEQMRPFDNVIKIKPPMVLTEADADMVVRVVDDVLAYIQTGL